MRYRKELFVPAGTSEAGRAETNLHLTHGIVREVEIGFPAGCAGLVEVAIRYHERQIYPTSPGASFRGDDVLITFFDALEVTEPPLAFSLVGWAPDAEYDHRISFGVTVAAVERKRRLFSGAARLPGGA